MSCHFNTESNAQATKNRNHLKELIGRFSNYELSTILIFVGIVPEKSRTGMIEQIVQRLTNETPHERYCP